MIAHYHGNGYIDILDKAGAVAVMARIVIECFSRQHRNLSLFQISRSLLFCDNDGYGYLSL